ncbi:MAG TPA: DUF5700 domain-containing putative Zn-dependent protease [Mucilaginibacter sp.]|jgi:hypothetical protein|nr:DUF5700 domain-containing putative Zn-dependent protease [Mucilaginibacter sp.]
MEAYRQKNDEKLQKTLNAGLFGAGPLYILGAEMTKTIVDIFGKNRLKEILPQGGVVFFKTYFAAVDKNKSINNLFSNEDEKIIREMDDEFDGD